MTLTLTLNPKPKTNPKVNPNLMTKINSEPYSPLNIEQSPLEGPPHS